MSTIDFAGFTWAVKQSSSKVGPGPNFFSTANVTTDDHGLHLRIAKAGAQWTCAEVIAQGEFGYGTYTWDVAADATRLDRNAVLGMFTWSDLPDHAHREIDIELSRWGGTHPIGSGVFTVQAGNVANDSRFSLARSPRSFHAMTWERGRVTFSSSTGAGPVAWSYTGRDMPRPGGCVTPRINLWLYRGSSPAAEQSVTVSRFRYQAVP